MPQQEIRIEMGPGGSQTYTVTSGTGNADFQNFANQFFTSANQFFASSGSGTNQTFNFPQFSTSSNVPPFPGASSSRADEPPSYKDVVDDEKDQVRDPLLNNKRAPSPGPTPTRTQPTGPVDVTHLLVDPESSLEDEECTADDFAMTCVRIGVIVAILGGIALVQWEESYQASVRAMHNPDWRAKKQFHLRSGFGWTLIALALAFYFADAWVNDVAEMFKKLSDVNLEQHLENVKRGKPKLTWYMKCFHRDTSTTVVTNADGTMRTEDRNDQITTWTGLESFRFSQWADVTPDQTKNFGSINKITFHSKYVLANAATRQAYEAQKKAFIDANKPRGAEYSIEEIFEIEGFEKEMLVESGGSCRASAVVYFFFVLTGLMYLWRYVVNSGVRRVAYTHVKQLSI
ncbi:uncharacterized protein LOC129601345 [Paramacrobiotus metropolitanus]|uniref:uncharacterized protein LOC129601345 n=1 Tax=Paramacrobiotus metropolitanus TaxID=2943436 RepID=UPI0024464B6C|nr:uncharacterized protein LOC129601345 [Paramacrobiotus metropolitanus]